MHLDWKNSDARLRCAVFGSGGGIGKGLVAELVSRPATASVIAYSSHDVPAEDRIDEVDYRTVDISSADSLARAASGVDGPLDVVLIAVGTLHTDSYRPERRLRELDADAMLEVYRINAVLPAMVAKHYLPLLHRERPTVFAALSARVGSISDNRLGGWMSYRASKAALNMLLKTLSIEHARSRKHSAIVGLHPGTVDTPLSKPFSGNVPEGKLFTPEQSARYLIDVVGHLRPDDTGSVFAWDGQRVPN